MEKTFSDYYFYNILRIFDVLPNFFIQKLKRWAIFTYKIGIYKCPHQLPNE